MEIRKKVGGAKEGGVEEVVAARRVNECRLRETDGLAFPCHTALCWQRGGESNPRCLA